MATILRGTYVRNPPSSRHTPGSEPGRTIFVKLWQFDPDDRTQLRIDTPALAFAPAPDLPGVELVVLFENACEHVRLERWASGAAIDMPVQGGIELLVLDGSFEARFGSNQTTSHVIYAFRLPRRRAEAGEGREEFTPHSWLRLPARSRLQATAGRHGCSSPT
jgi:ChrR Cupin-like domain